MTPWQMIETTRAGGPTRRRRRKPGVPRAGAIVLVIMALLMGALGGYAVARKTDPHVHELQAAKDRVMELENTLTLIGYPVDDDVDPQQWLYDSNLQENALAGSDRQGLGRGHRRGRVERRVTAERHAAGGRRAGGGGGV